MKNINLLIKCKYCGGDFKNHEILQEYKETNDHVHYSSYGTYQICKCKGCNNVVFRQEISDDADYDHDEDGNIILAKNITVFPHDNTDERTSKFNYSSLPVKVEEIYNETLLAINVDAKVLACVGVRGIVESICKDVGIKDGNLLSKINKLKDENFLTSAQAEVLHEARYIGNDAIHEFRIPSTTDLENVLEIIEIMLNTIYILPIKAEQLKKNRISVKD